MSGRVAWNLRWLVATVGPIAALLAACGAAGPKDDRPLVAVSVAPLAYFVDRIAGDRVAVQVIIPPGANPMTFAPGMAERTAMARAVLYVKVGHPGFAFERAWLDPLLTDAPGLLVADAAQGIEPESGDPHLWLSPPMARLMALSVEAGLAEILPDGAAALRANLDALLNDIDRLDADLQTRFAPHAGKAFIVDHPAWGAFARRYGLEQVAIEAEGREPSSGRLAELIERGKSELIGVVFVQPQFDRTRAEMVAAEIGAEVVVIDPLARNWLAALRSAAESIAEGLEQ